MPDAAKAVDTVGEAEPPAACPLVQSARLSRSAMQAASEAAEAGVQRLLVPPSVPEHLRASAVCPPPPPTTCVASAGSAVCQCTCRAALLWAALALISNPSSPTATLPHLPPEELQQLHRLAH